jgi:hypothetical protein
VVFFFLKKKKKNLKFEKKNFCTTIIIRLHNHLHIFDFFDQKKNIFFKLLFSLKINKDQQNQDTM